MGARKCPFRERGDKKRKSWFFHATHSLPYLSRVCFSSNFVKHKHLMTGFKGYSEFSFPNGSQRGQSGSNKKWLLSWEV